jgi:hypothetical protein
MTGEPMSSFTHLSFWDRTRDFLVFLATVVAVLAGAEVVMLLRGGDVEARTGQPAAGGAEPAVRSADDATWAAGSVGLDVEPARRSLEATAGGAANQKPQ